MSLLWKLRYGQETVQLMLSAEAPARRASVAPFQADPPPKAYRHRPTHSPAPPSLQDQVLLLLLRADKAPGSSEIADLV